MNGPKQHMSLGQSACKARILHGLKRKELAERAGVSTASLYNIEHDLQVPSVLIAEALASALDISIEEYIGKA